VAHAIEDWLTDGLAGRAPRRSAHGGKSWSRSWTSLGECRCQRPFQVRPDWLASPAETASRSRSMPSNPRMSFRVNRIQLAGIWRELEDRQPVPGGDQLAHRAADVGGEVGPGPGSSLVGWPVSPDRFPHPACPFPGTGRSRTDPWRGRGEPASAAPLAQPLPRLARISTQEDRRNCHAGRRWRAGRRWPGRRGREGRSAQGLGH
jgi:hypothetical protein